MRSFLVGCNAVIALAFASLVFGAEENLRPFAPGGPVHEISVTSSASTAVRLLPTASGWLGCTQYKLENLGTTDVNVGFGSTAAIAQTNAADVPAPGNTGLAVLVRASSAFSTTQIANAYLSAKTASGTSTIRAGCGTGTHTGPGGNVNVSGGSLTADQGTPGTTANAWPVKVTDGTLTGTVRDTGASDSVNVAIVDAAGAQITTFGGATGPGGGTMVEGVAAHDAVIAGNPIRLGARAVSGSIAVVAAADTVDLRASTSGVLAGGNQVSAADGESNSMVNAIDEAGAPRKTAVGGFVYNGATWDRIRGNTLGSFVQGPIADNVAPSGNPVLIAGRQGAGSNLTKTISTGAAGGVSVAVTTVVVDDFVTTSGVIPEGQNSASVLLTGGSVWDGAGWDRIRTAGIGNNVTSTGIAAATPYGQYLGNATQSALTTGNYGAAQLDPAGNLRTAPQRPTATDILNGYATVTATTASTTLITVSAGRTWVGTLCASVDGNKAAAATGNGLVNATFLTTGTGVVPATGTWFGVGASIGANAATGATGSQGTNSECSSFTTVAPAGNSTTINYATTCTNTTACAIHVSAIGVMQ